MTLTLIIVWTGILLSPPAAFLIASYARKRWPKAVLPTLFGSALILLVIFAALKLDFTLTNAVANGTVLAVSYLTYCYLAASSWKIPIKLIRIPLAVAGIFPIVCGYFFGTFGFLGLLFMVSDWATPPYLAAPMSVNVSCEQTLWGFAGNSGYTVHLYKQWKLVPFVEREIAKAVVNQGESDPELSCEDVWRNYLKRP